AFLLKDSGVCFACGQANPEGMRLTIRRVDGGVQMDYVVPDKFCGWKGVVHGGIIATMLDELAAWACTEAGSNAVTAELSVRFRHPVSTGQKLRGFGRVVEEHGRLLLAESRLTDEQGTVLANARAKMMKVEAQVVRGE
ncbi:MAG: PaaI family thioesterase, partial [candidate division WOR-3 bacterium]